MQSPTPVANNHNMSCLASFVAAALRDRTTADLAEEVRTLRAERDERLMVRITGNGGLPVYFETPLSSGKSVRGGFWKVSFERGGPPVPTGAIRTLEIRLGGMALQDFREDGFAVVLLSLLEGSGGDGTSGQHGVHGTMFVSDIDRQRPVSCIRGSIGPVLPDNDTDWFESTREMEVYFGERECDLRFEGVTFRKSKIQGILSLLGDERLTEEGVEDEDGRTMMRWMLMKVNMMQMEVGDDDDDDNDDDDHDEDEEDRIM